MPTPVPGASAWKDCELADGAQGRQERAVVQPSGEPVLSDELYLPVTAAVW